MPQLQNVILTDRSTPTAVNHTFAPRDIVNNVGSVVESSGMPAGDNRMTITLKRTTTGRFKPSLQFTFPIVVNETINGVVRPTVLRTSYVDLTFNFDGSSTEQERKNVVGMIESALGAGKILVNDTVIKLEGVY